MAENIEALVDEIVADGKLTTEEKKKIDAFMTADGVLSVEERKQIDRVLMMIAKGELEVVP